MDFGLTASDYAKHRAGFPDELYDRLRARGIGAPGLRVLDLGTGTGTMARAWARRGLLTIGLDPSPALLAQARALDAEAGVDIAYLEAHAEATGLGDACCDIVSAGQCWHWFDAPRAAAEIARVLVPGGALVIAHFDWLPLAGNVVELTERLIEQHNPSWKYGGGHGLHPECLRHLREAGFGEVETFSFDVDQPYSHERWRGRIRASAGVGASLEPSAVAAFDAALADLLARRFPSEPLSVPHRVFAVVCRNRVPARGAAGTASGSSGTPAEVEHREVQDSH